MFDVALLEKCMDPSLTPEIVEKFVADAGSDDPLTVSVKAGGRLVLVPKPHSTGEAMEIVRQYVGAAGVRVGITQFPAGVGITDPSQLDPGLADACENLKVGTKMFAKVARIVTHWYGSPTTKDVVPQMLDDAIYAWKTGRFEGVNVFQAPDPGGNTFLRRAELSGKALPVREGDPVSEVPPAAGGALETEAGNAGIRIHLSRIGAGK